MACGEMALNGMKVVFGHFERISDKCIINYTIPEIQQTKGEIDWDHPGGGGGDIFTGLPASSLFGD